MPGIRLAVLAVACTALVPLVGPSQDPRFASPGGPQGPQLPGLSLARTYEFSASQNAFPRLGRGGSKLDLQIAEVARKMRQAETGSDRSEAEKELVELLSQDYDQRLNGYAQEIDRLEEAIDEMRAKLEKRRDAKSEMIDLRIRVLEAEADDLGWPEHHRGTHRFNSNVPGPASSPRYFRTPSAARTSQPKDSEPVRTRETANQSRSGR